MTLNVNANHHQHLLDEGFTEGHIEQMIETGVRSIDAVTASSKGFRLKDVNGTYRSSGGLYFPFTAGFGQIRADEPLTNSAGKVAKYLTPIGAKSEAMLPNGCKVITEGWKDAQAGSLHGGIPTGALAGVSHYRKALAAGSGYTVLFDADGWTNPGVFTNLFNAGVYLKGKIQLVPEIAGQPKAGLCEYFKSGATAEDYRSLLDSAMSPDLFLWELPKHWKNLDPTCLEKCVDALLRLTAGNLGEIAQEKIVDRIAESTKLSKRLLGDRLRKIHQFWQKRKKEFQSQPKPVLKPKVRATESIDPASIVDSQDNSSDSDDFDQPTLPPALDPADEVTISTIDNHIYCRLFGAGRGNYITLNDAFYRYTDRGYWSKFDDRRIYKLIGQQCRKAYKVRRDAKGTARETTYPFAKDGAMKSAFNFSRSLLDHTSDLPYNNHLMCFENGVVDLRTGELSPHDRSHFLTSAITAPYLKNAQCPEVFRSFVASAFGEELLEVVQAVTSMLLDPTAYYGQFVHLIGQSGSGKGTLLRLWQEMFGVENVKGINSFSELETAEGRHQNLSGVRLCTFGDVGGYMKGLKSFYELVDNGPMSGRALYSPSGYQTKWNVRFVIASVDHLQIENSGDGWDRRVIPLPTKPRSGEIDRTLGDRLSEAKGEIISWALSISRQRRDWILANLGMYERIETAMADASISGDPVRYFVDLCLRPSAPTEASTPIQNHMLHTWYEAFCLVHGYQRMSMSRFVSHLKTILPGQHQPRRRAVTAQCPDRPWIPAHWIGLKPLATVFESTEEGAIKCIKADCVEGGLAAFVHANNTNGITMNSTQSTGQTEKYTFELSSETVTQQEVYTKYESTGQIEAVEKNGGFESDVIHQVDTAANNINKFPGFLETPVHPVPPVPSSPERVSADAKKCTQQIQSVRPEKLCTVHSEHFEKGDRVWVQKLEREGVVIDTRNSNAEYLVEGSGFYGWQSNENLARMSASSNSGSEAVK